MAFSLWKFRLAASSGSLAAKGGDEAMVGGGGRVKGPQLKVSASLARHDYLTLSGTILLRNYNEEVLYCGPLMGIKG